MEQLSEAEFQRRLPLLCALTAMFLDTEVTAHELNRIAVVAAQASYTPEEVESMLFDDLGPVFGSNLTAPVGEWALWPQDFVEAKMKAWYSRAHKPGGLAAAALRRLLHDDWERLRERLARNSSD